MRRAFTSAATVKLWKVTGSWTCAVQEHRRLDELSRDYSKL
jgi:hypothetical protein